METYKGIVQLSGYVASPKAVDKAGIIAAYDKGAYLKRMIQGRLIEHRQYIDKHG